MNDSEFDKLLFDLSQCSDDDIDDLRVPIILELLKDKSKRITQVLGFIRSYVPRKQPRKDTEEFRNMLDFYFAAKEFEDKIELRNYLVAYITSATNPRQHIFTVLESVRYHNTDKHVVDAIGILSRLKTDTSLICNEMLGGVAFIDPDAYIIAYAAGKANPGLVWKLVNSQHVPIREAAIELLAASNSRKAVEELKKIAINDQDDYVRKLAEDFLSQRMKHGDINT